MEWNPVHITGNQQYGMLSRAPLCYICSGRCRYYPHLSNLQINQVTLKLRIILCYLVKRILAGLPLLLGLKNVLHCAGTLYHLA